jgi:hypothetical protein
MLAVTDAAGAYLAQLLSDHDLSEDVAVRFIVEEQGLSLRQDNERPGDTTFEHEGRTVLLLDEQVSELLSADTLDIEDAQLTLSRPGGDA